MNLDGLRAGGKPALAAALSLIERKPDDPATIALLDAAWADPKAHVLGLTGPPGVGKSTLLNALVKSVRARGQTLGVIAVDPSSRRTGGALLGDRTRLRTDPEDQGCFIRSMAARDRLGGLAALTYPAMVLMRAVYDLVIIETVGVGQSETDVADVADTVVFCVQPASGDSLQFMKAGIAEEPHIALVTKADLGKPAHRAAADVKGALSMTGAHRDDWHVPVMLLSAQTGEGVAAFLDKVDEHAAMLDATGTRANVRAGQDRVWLEQRIREERGKMGLHELKASLPTRLSMPFAHASRLLGIA